MLVHVRIYILAPTVNLILLAIRKYLFSLSFTEFCLASNHYRILWCPPQNFVVSTTEFCGAQHRILWCPPPTTEFCVDQSTTNHR